jgi:hypothetical protein
MTLAMLYSEILDSVLSTNLPNNWVTMDKLVTV